MSSESGFIQHNFQWVRVVQHFGVLSYSRWATGRLVGSKFVVVDERTGGQVQFLTEPSYLAGEFDICEDWRKRGVTFCKLSTCAASCGIATRCAHKSCVTVVHQFQSYDSWLNAFSHYCLHDSKVDGGTYCGEECCRCDMLDDRFDTFSCWSGSKPSFVLARLHWSSKTWKGMQNSWQSTQRLQRSFSVFQFMLFWQHWKLGIIQPKAIFTFDLRRRRIWKSIKNQKHQAH